MKKILALILVAVMLASFSACGSVNETEVSILWSDSGVVQAPNSLSNAMERALYTVNIAYTYYGANGSADTQLQQAKQAIDGGCAALAVNPVDPTTAQSIVDLAKAKNVPVVFFGCQIDEAVLASYDKCACVYTNTDSINAVQGQLIADFLADEKNLAATDLNGDGVIGYLALGNVAGSVSVVTDVELVEVPADSVAGLTVTTVAREKAEYGLLTNAMGEPVEMIITDSDLTALEVLVDLQAKDFNKNKLTTHYISIFTVGTDADYKAHVLASRPEGDDARKEYYDQMQYLVNLTGLKEDAISAMVYNTMNIIDDGRIRNTAMEDYETLSNHVASILLSFLKGEDLQDNNLAVDYKPYA